MSIWDRPNTDFEKYIVEPWGYSPIGWQQNNRNILNKAIETYNKYVRSKCTLEEVVEAILDAEMALKDECGDYLDDIAIIKSNVEEIELIRNSGNW